MLRVVIAMVVSALAAALGQIAIRRGMQQIGSLETYEPLALLGYFGQATLNPYVIAGIGLNFIAFLLVIAGLSWKGVTVVMPFAALQQLFLAVLAIVLLQEAVSPTRWAGIMFVIVGVMLVTYSVEQERTPHRSVERQAIVVSGDG
jgi:drug/metabolite transporter (DMT)-like permease